MRKMYTKHKNTKALQLCIAVLVVGLALLSTCTFRKAVQQQLGVVTQQNPSKGVVSTMATCHYYQTTQVAVGTNAQALATVPVITTEGIAFPFVGQPSKNAVVYTEQFSAFQTKIPLYILYKKFKVRA